METYFGVRQAVRVVGFRAQIKDKMMYYLMDTNLNVGVKSEWLSFRNQIQNKMLDLLPSNGGI